MATVVQLRPGVGHMMYRDFMAAGHPIFPIYRFKTNGQCECGDPECPAPSKHPRASNWQHTPLWDDDQVESMEMAGHLDTGYGVLCRGLLVVDVDARNGGVESYAKLKRDVAGVDDAGLTVATGSGGGSQHLYFTAPDDVAMVTHLPDYPGIDFKSSGYVVGPGSAHKSGGVYVADGYPDDIGPAPQGLIDLLRRPERHRSEFNGHAVDLAHEDIADMLSHVRNDDLPYEDWIAIGMAIHHATQGSGFDLWDRWSATSGKHDAAKMQYKWGSFGRSANPVTVGTLIHHAEQGGWVMPVTFVPDQQFNDEPAEVAADGLPFDISGVDLTAPPGFVGEVAQWIDGQSLRPRKNLAVAAALVTIGNVGGLRYVDDISGVTANLFAFCIAGSRTGKDGILKGSLAILRAAGIDGACHGGIKSEQEIIKNLTRHQASFYLVDEVAHFFSKIMNAQKQGGAHYLEGIPAMLMASYTKADDFLGITGDVKDGIKRDLLGELSKIEIMMDGGEKPHLIARRESITRTLSNIDHGIERPFVSFMGVTVPNKFEMMMSKDMATNGFIGRSLIFNERETVPKARKLMAREKLPEHIGNYVRAIWTGGEYDSQAPMRVENYDEPTTVPTDANAAEMMSAVLEWMEEQAEARKETEMESLYLGGYEIVAKVSLILAIPERLRTSEHVRWAFALVKRDIEEKIREVIGNDSVKHEPLEAMTAKILNLASKEGGEKEGIIVSRLKRVFKKEDIIAQLERMARTGKLECKESTHPRNGTAFKSYGCPK